MFAVEGHSMVAFTAAYRVFSYLFVASRIDFSDYVFVLKVYVDTLGDRIVTRIARLALKVKGCNNLVFHDVHYSLSMTPFVGNVDFMEWRCIGNAIGL